MASPFPKSSSAPGEGHITVQLLPHNISALSTIVFQYPLKLISPSPSASQKSVLVFLLTYGGGLVGGDQVHLTITIKSNAKLSIVTQGHTKIFKSPTQDVVTRQALKVSIEDGAALCLLPDPVQPFEGSVYEQSQRFVVSDKGSLCLLDWVSAGRTARGEDWDLWGWRGRNEVLLAQPEGKDRLLLRDNVILGSENKTDVTLKEKMHGLGIFGTLILRGPLVQSLSEFLLAEFSSLPRIGGRDFRSQEKVDEDKDVVLAPREIWRLARIEQEKKDSIWWSAARVRGCVVVKFGAPTVEGGRTFIGSMLKEEGSISSNFGYDSMICVR